LWQLFLDESGDFGNNTASCVAGLLVQEPRSPAWDAAIREFLARSFPLVPYPPHAAALNRPASRVAGCLACEPRTPLDRHAAAKCTRLADAVRAARAPELEVFVAEALAGRMPEVTHLDVASEWLERHAAPEYAALRSLCREQEHNFHFFLRRLCEDYGPTRCFMVGAACVPHVAWPEEAPRDLYLATLEVLLERVLALLRADDQVRRHVWVHAATRHVSLPDLPAVVPLRAQDVGEAVARAEAFPYLAPPAGRRDDRVRLVADVPPRFDSRVPPGVVLADFVANRLRWQIERANWSGLARAMRKQLGLSGEAPARGLPAAGPLPTVAASGLARSAVIVAFDGKSAPALPSGPPDWPREQAEAWIAAGLAACGSGGAA
jgi:hypothetical protein